VRDTCVRSGRSHPRRFDLRIFLLVKVSNGSQADSCTAANAPHSITSSARPRRVSGKLTPSALAADGKRHADRFEEFTRLSRLNENIGKTDQEIWEMVA
jgi:hypothetical protein